MKKSIDINIEIPSVPNFLRSKDQHSVISIKDFTKKELEVIGAEWTKALIKQAQKRKNLMK
jgi:hypothetical protein